MRIWHAIKWWFAYYLGYSLLLGFLGLGVGRIFNIAMGMALVHTYIKLRNGGVPQTYRAYTAKRVVQANERERERVKKEAKASERRRAKERRILDSFRTEFDIAKISSRHRVSPSEVRDIIANGVRNGLVRGEFTRGNSGFVSSDYIKTLLLEEA
ncbi:hypothetical protein JXL21_09995 [Candidatus Bathyarchaeota archaeon]|nr:hypothetical protein [Candidatus Bathyarchaeota archaeon]